MRLPRISGLVLVAGALALFSFGCASTASTSSWVGRSQSELIGGKGKPTKTYSEADGRTVWVYARPIPLAPASGDDSGTLRQAATLTWYEEFDVDGKGIVTGHSTGVIPASLNPFN